MWSTYFFHQSSCSVAGRPGAIDSLAAEAGMMLVTLATPWNWLLPCTVNIRTIVLPACQSSFPSTLSLWPQRLKWHCTNLFIIITTTTYIITIQSRFTSIHGWTVITWDCIMGELFHVVPWWVGGTVQRRRLPLTSASRHRRTLTSTRQTS